MAVVVAILKTIGMILLVLLALCVLLLCAALFVPVRYRVTVETKDEIQVRCQISWLLRVVYIVQETLERHPYPYFRNPARPAQKNSCIFPANEKNSGKEGRNEGNSAGRAGGRRYRDDRFFG